MKNKKNRPAGRHVFWARSGGWGRVLGGPGLRGTKAPSIQIQGLLVATTWFWSFLKVKNKKLSFGRQNRPRNFVSEIKPSTVASIVITFFLFLVIVDRC